MLKNEEGKLKGRKEEMRQGKLMSEPFICPVQ
jgi:hypothetical protein